MVEVQKKCFMTLREKKMQLPVLSLKHPFLFMFMGYISCTHLLFPLQFLEYPVPLDPEVEYVWRSHWNK